MTIEFATDIAHPIGFLTGAVVYALLLVMVLREFGGVRLAEGSWHQRIRLPLYIAILGLLWNLASLAALLVTQMKGVAEPALLTLLATSALGALPAVAMHSVWQTIDGAARRSVVTLTVAGYGLSLTAAAWNMLATFSGNAIPVLGAWRLLTIGFLVLFISVLWVCKRMLAGRGGLVLVFLALCSIVVLPLSHHPDASLPWWFDFFEHHASLPVAIAVLYRDYRFTFIDHFLKRILSFLLLVGICFGLYVTVVLPLFQGGAGGPIPAASSGLIIGVWVLTALAYPWALRHIAWAFDVLLLHRPDYQDLRRQLAQHVSRRDTADTALTELCQQLERAWRSRTVSWGQGIGIPQLPSLSEGSGTGNSLPLAEQAELTGPVQTLAGEVSIVVPTMEGPRVVLTVAPCREGRRFLSEDLMLLETAALIVARRIDALRTSHERCELALREQEMQKLTTEAELRALRAQVNPHFLFNALNTIGYLIETAPERAASTLKDLTYLLRGILRRMDGSFTTLGEEIELIRAYLDIEQARFEERLVVRIDVPEDLTGLQVPALVVQPIVENAVKHGIQPSLNGGVITITARTMPNLSRHRGDGPAAELLSVEVSDTGAGATVEQLRRGRHGGIGLMNVERRLRCHYGERASMNVCSEPGVGTTVEIRLPASNVAPQTAMPVASAAAHGESR